MQRKQPAPIVKPDHIKPDNIEEVWRVAGAEVLTALLSETGNELKDLMHVAQAQMLRRAEPWHRFINADPTLPPGAFKAVLKEVCRFYNLPVRHRGKYEKVQRVMAACR